MSKKTFYEGNWDCSDCQTVGILGRHKFCPECGNPRDPILTPEEKPYLPADAKPIDSPELIDLFSDGPDWNCGFCGEANAAKYDTCGKCQKPKDSDDTVNRKITYENNIHHDENPNATLERVEDDIDHANRIIENPNTPRIMDDLILPADQLRTSGELADRLESYDEEKKSYDIKELISNHRNFLYISGAILIVALFSIFIYSHYFTTEPINLTVEKVSWNRQIEVEKYKTLHESDWSYPSDARVTDSYSKIHHYDHVAVGSHTEYYTDYETYQSGTESYTYTCGSRTVDNGNGGFYTETETCTGSRPVYSTRSVQKTRTVTDYEDVPRYYTYYEYDVDRWVTNRWLITQDTNQNPIWASTEGNYSNSNRLGNERIGNERKETYTVYLVDDSGKKRFTQTPSFEIWSQLTLNQKVVGQINNAGNLRSVDWKINDHQI